ncbi:MAG: tetratricopeptide repeat protein [Bacteroidota bacterium]|nr:tetratricopeptide repeat protein [Bacteroidota bacterium]
MKYRLILLFLISTSALFSQSASEGETYFNNKQFSKARSVYEVLLKKKPNDATFNFRYARCCYELKDVENAIIHFEKAGNKFPTRNLYLGELYFNSYRFDESVLAYQNYLATLQPADSKLPEYQQRIKKAENAARLMTRVEDIAIIDSVVVNKDEFLKFYKFNRELGSLSQESIKLKGHHKTDKVKYITQRQDRVYFSDSIKGQMDIFTSYKLLDGWSQPASVSDVINTPANENYPFLQSDGVTIYFASDGDNSIGGYDLFVTRYNPSTDSYLTPENMGMPFNSPFNDYMMVIDDQRKLGWFATDRYQPGGKVMIYTFIPNEVKNIIHSEDKDYLRRAAQLKTYRKVSGSVPDSINVQGNRVPESEKQIEFVINDSIVYTNVNQFKSEEAVKLWNELHKLSIELNNKIKELADLRAKYDRTEKESERSGLAPNIMELEKKNIELKKQLSIKTTQVRKMEIDFLLKKK